MTTEPKSTEQERPKQKVIYRNAASAPVHGFSLIGAWVYYLTHSATLWMGALGILKGIVWPAMLVYELMKYLHM